MDEIIRGSKTVLKPLEMKDVDMIVEWLQNPKVQSKCLNSDLYRKSKLKEWFHNKNNDEKRYILNTSDNKSIGNVFLTVNDDVGYINIMIGDVIYGGKGYGKDAMKALVKYCFDELRLGSIEAVFSKNNVRAEYCCFSCGFKKYDTSMADNYSKDNYTMIINRKDYIGY